MRNKSIVALLCMVLLLNGCAEPSAQPPTGQPVSTASSPTTPPSAFPPVSDAPGGGDETDTSFSFADISNLTFWFGSGAGAWGTVVVVHDDGTFEGEYSDTDMGDSGTPYPKGTRYLSRFTGTLSEPLRVNSYTYSVTLEQIELAREPDTEEIRDGVKYIYSNPYGLNDAETLLFYLPGAPVRELPEEYTNWARGYGHSIDAELPFYGLYNLKAGQGFSSHETITIDDELASFEQETALLEQQFQTESLSQADMTENASTLYSIWDAKINDLWSRLNYELDTAPMKALKAEQLDLIAYKEVEMKNAGADVEGGTLQPMLEYKKGTELTRARVYELAAYLR